MHPTPEDGKLLADYKDSGNLEFLGELYKRYMPLVYGVCLKYLKDRDKSQDAVMDIFEQLIESTRKHEIRNFKSWLHVISRNHCLMILRSASYRQDQKNISGQEIFMESSYTPHHENGQGNEEDLRSLSYCIEQLQNEQKECVRLFYLEHLSYRQIVQRTSYDDKKVKSYIQNGKRNLKICMENQREKTK